MSRCVFMWSGQDNFCRYPEKNIMNQLTKTSFFQVKNVVPSLFYLQCLYSLNHWVEERHLFLALWLVHICWQTNRAYLSHDTRPPCSTKSYKHRLLVGWFAGFYSRQDEIIFLFEVVYFVERRLAAFQRFQRSSWSAIVVFRQRKWYFLTTRVYSRSSMLCTGKGDQARFVLQLAMLQ